MSISIGGYPFEGPYSSVESLDDRSGIYAILTKRTQDYKVLDVGESAAVKSRVSSHDRKPCWTRNSLGSIYYSVHYTPNLQQSGRIEIEQKLRDQYDPPCGKQ